AMVAPTENAALVTNIVQVQTTATNDNIATIQSRIEHYVRRNADLAVQQAAVLETVPGVSPAQFKLKYTLMAANSGPAVAANVLITQVLPVGALYDAALSSTRCTETTAHSGIIRCNLNELNDGRSSVLNLIATIPAAQGPFFPSQVLVASSAPDPNAVNNRVSTVLFDRVSVAQLYLPVAFAVRQRAPDLVVKEIRITPENAEVVIQNIGDTPLLPTDRFWVDLYINPNPPPTGVNQTIQERQSDGLVWGVISPTLQLAPGAAYTLRFGDHYYDHDQSSVPAQIKAGSVIYVQVDSANLESDAGGVLEEHEMAGGASNNIAVIAIGETISTLNWKTAHHEQRTNAASRNAALLLR
ncbi:MAG: hypothetical protein KDE31_03855, partial [Caldilineaceae bacterium]|nr:hypothetical protein [Caldilineaceae bacterium]